MKIGDSLVSMDSHREVKEQSIERVRLRRRGEDENPVDDPETPRDKVTLSNPEDVPLRPVRDVTEQMRELSKGREMEEIDLEITNPELEKLKRILQLISGKKIEITSHERGSEGGTFPGVATEMIGPGGMGLVVESSRYESESTSFHASGRITTEDGRRVNFDLGLTMDREYYAEQTRVVNAPRSLVDPLVINFSGKPAALSEEKFTFDLDGDGSEEEISLLQEGSAFLALDKNGNGVVDDGSELFGATTGNGFGELAELDGDGNGWIDENDELFGRLLVWSKDGGGGDRLSGLADEGVGAIYLKSAETLFTHKDSENGDLGRTARTGIYLKEDGGAGTIQHVDFAV